jgi:Mg-chelatase subunit ChlD
MFFNVVLLGAAALLRGVRPGAPNASAPEPCEETMGNSSHAFISQMRANATEVAFDRAAQCASMLDVIFIIDASGAVDDNSFNAQKLLAAKLAAPLITGPTKMAVMMYTGAATIVGDFTESAESLIIKLAALKRPDGWKRDSAKALAKADWLLMSGGRANAKSTIFMVVAGAPLDIGAMEHMASKVKMTGTRLMIAAVGQRFNQYDRAQDWASWPAEMNTFQAVSAAALPPAHTFFYDICPSPVQLR